MDRAGRACAMRLSRLLYTRAVHSAGVAGAFHSAFGANVPATMLGAGVPFRRRRRLWTAQAVPALCDCGASCVLVRSTAPAWPARSIAPSARTKRLRRERPCDHGRCRGAVPPPQAAVDRAGRACAMRLSRLLYTRAVHSAGVASANDPATTLGTGAPFRRRRRLWTAQALPALCDCRASSVPARSTAPAWPARSIAPSARTKRLRRERSAGVAGALHSACGANEAPSARTERRRGRRG